MTSSDAALHTVHIPVMGTSFTIDTPIKCARFGLSSVMSIGDDELCEYMRKHYCGVSGEPYKEIRKWEEDYRARRITEYLNLVDRIVKKQILDLKSQSFTSESELTAYFDMLPDFSPAKKRYLDMVQMPEGAEKTALQNALRDEVRSGSLDVNIMTKIDRVTYSKEGVVRPPEFTDALSALRGFANSTLHASIVFSAGFNRHLYAYIEKFEDFFPDATGYLKKKIILKVSDYRSSLTQGKFLAKKGVWVSEHRIESGLNCGGHVFPSEGNLLGPILEEFKQNKKDLCAQLYEVCNQALREKGRPVFNRLPYTRLTVQGGIGTAKEQRFLMDYFDCDGTGWATPFLLVPEVTTVDEPTRHLLAKTTRDQLYTSRISPLGVRFNTFRGSESEKLRLQRIANGKPGSPCPKGFLVSNTEFTEVPICTASVLYQKKKIDQLNSMNLSEPQYEAAFEKVVAKTCLCEDLAAGALIETQQDNRRPLAPAVCPGPNLAYFSRFFTLAEMLGHIYGRWSVLNETPRPNMFVAELKIYIDYLRMEISDVLPKPTSRQVEYLEAFKRNLFEGIDYYKGMIPKLVEETQKYQETMREELAALAQELEGVISEHRIIFSVS